ncbi:MAG: hypothetical protein AAF941_02850 [Pseudomonadota bacterium]
MRQLFVTIPFLTKPSMPRIAFSGGDFAAVIRLQPLVELRIGAFRSHTMDPGEI